MKHFTFDLKKKLILLFAVILSSATLSAQDWNVVYSNSMSGETADAVSLESPIFHDGSWIVKENGASVMLGKTGAENFGPCLETTNKGNYIGIEYTPDQTGTYKFSFVHKVKSGDLCANAKLTYSTDMENWEDAYDALVTAIAKEDDETGDEITSTEIQLTGGTKYYFKYELGLTFASATDLHVADFKLSMLGGEVSAATYKFSYTVEGDATVTITDKNKNEIPNNTELEKYAQYDVVATPASDDNAIEFYINGNHITENWYKEDNANVYHFSGFMDIDTELLIKVVKNTSGLKNIAQQKAYYDSSAETIFAEGNIEIYELTGKMVLKGANSLNVSGLNKGIYLAKTKDKVFKFKR